MSEWSLQILQSPFGYLFSFIWGALFGSFANVCIYRIPRAKSIVFPGSSCTACQKAIPAYDNIPLLGFLILRGRCRFCKTLISSRYPLIELLMIVLSLILYRRFIFNADGSVIFRLVCYLTSFFFVLTLLILSAIDWELKILPNKITYPAIVVFFGLGRIVQWVSLWNAVLSMIGGYLLIRILSDGYYYLTKREGLGYGDGKLLAIVGGLLGYQCLISTVLFGSILGILAGIPVLLWQRRHQTSDTAHLQTSDTPRLRHMSLPFGPFLSMGAFIALLLFAGRDVSDVLFRLGSKWFLE